MIDLTVVIGIDARTIEQAYYSIPTWCLHRSEMWTMPWVVFYDPSQLLEEQVDKFIDDMQLPAVVSLWEHEYESQREKMLTGFIHIPPAVVETQWWMKIDTDSLAMPCHNWLEPGWFEPENGEYAEYIASGWGYTKAKGGGGTAEQWAERLEQWGDQFDTPRLGLAEHVRGNKIRYKRMASWISYYNTEASKKLSACCTRDLPVPSQDTMVWYHTARRRARCIHTGMKKRNWTNISRTHKLRAAALEICNG